MNATMLTDILCGKKQMRIEEAIILGNYILIAPKIENRLHYLKNPHKNSNKADFTQRYKIGVK